jgi:type I restriction enzyme M protein
VAGVIASWWGGIQNDLMTIVARGFLGLVESWEASILAAMEDTKSKVNPLDHKLVKQALKQYLVEIDEAQARKAGLDEALKTASGDDDDGDGDEMTEAEVADLQTELIAVKKEIKRLQRDFVVRLHQNRLELHEDAARDLVLGILQGDLRAILGTYVDKQRTEVTLAFETWWDKYRVTLRAIDVTRGQAIENLNLSLSKLRYA